jgi:hypothetical protein
MAVMDISFIAVLLKTHFEWILSRLQVKRIQFGPMDRSSLCLQIALSSTLKTEVEPISETFLIQDKTMDNIQNYCDNANITSALTYGPKLPFKNHRIVMSLLHFIDCLFNDAVSTETV